jgi:heme exporter protein C
MKILHYFANPRRFMILSSKIRPGVCYIGLTFGIIGLWLALWHSPQDYQQGEFVRLMYLHVPLAWLSMLGYLSLGLLSASVLIWRHPLAVLVAIATANTGALYTALCLITGMIWGKPTWGTWWVWDARLTSMAFLLLLYIGYLMLKHHEKQASILAVAGLVNLPIIKFSVEWWQTLHQPASIMRQGGIAIDITMLWPLLVCTGAFMCYYVASVFFQVETSLYTRKRQGS